MKQPSPIIQTLLVMFIPFYAIYWLYKTSLTMRSRGGNPPSLWMLFGPILLLIGLVILSVVGRVVSGGVEDVANVLTVTLGFVALLSAVVLSLMYYYKFSNTAETVTGGKHGTLVIFIFFLVLSPVSVYLIQDGLNSTAPTSTSPDQVIY